MSNTALTEKGQNGENPYSNLQDINEVKPFDPQADAALMHDIYRVLQKHNAVDRFGVNLLHDHFEVEDGEWMVETHDEQSRTLTIKPYRNEKLQEPNSILQETNWRFDEKGKVVVMQVCVKDLQGRHREII